MSPLIFTRRTLVTGTLIVTMLSTNACVSNNTNDAVITVTSTKDSCSVSPRTIGSGTTRFEVSNTSDGITEFYLLKEDGLAIAGELENIGPGLKRDLVIDAQAGKYFTVCKPGMKGAGVGKELFTVTDSGKKSSHSEDTKALISVANKNYKSYVKDQVAQLLSATEAFAASYLAHNDDEARKLYAPSRGHWERVETIATSFGDLDPKLDLREADLEPGQEWTGWHAIEKDLWPPADASPAYVPLNDDDRKNLSKLLVEDTRTLNSKVQKIDFTLDQQTNGAIALLDEVATGKVTGEEEVWSHTDLWDFQANIDGARVLYTGVRDIILSKNKQLAKTLDTEFSAMQTALDTHKIGDGFTLYTNLTTDEIKTLSDRVNALHEPLSKVTTVVLGS